jgi:hypothetical protein
MYVCTVYQQAVIVLAAPDHLLIPLFLTGTSFIIYAAFIYAQFSRNTTEA